MFGPDKCGYTKRISRCDCRNIKRRKHKSFKRVFAFFWRYWKKLVDISLTKSLGSFQEAWCRVKHSVPCNVMQCIHQLPKAFWNLRYTSHLQLQGEECVEEIGFGIQARKWRHFSCLSLNLEARQHCPSRDWWWEDLRRIPEGGLGAFGPQGQVGWTYSIEHRVREILYPNWTLELFNIGSVETLFGPWIHDHCACKNAFLTCSRFFELVLVLLICAIVSNTHADMIDKIDETE